MRILALITARGGSKRLPNKNIKLLGGKPLIVWSIDAAKNITEICDILVSTDDQDIADVSRDAGALVPWLRPAELANDTALSIDVALHALDWYESEKGPVDGLLLLQPTSPFRSRKTIMNGIQLFGKGRHSVVTVTEVKAHPSRCFYINKNLMNMFYKSDILDESAAFAVNGELYLTTPSLLRKNNTLVNKNTFPIIIKDPRESLDIDTEWDWWIAENILKSKQY